MGFFHMFQGSLNQKVRFLGQKVCSVASVQPDTHTRESEYRGHSFMVSGIFPSTYHRGSVQLFWKKKMCFSYMFVQKQCVHILNRFSASPSTLTFILTFYHLNTLFIIVLAPTPLLRIDSFWVALFLERSHVILSLWDHDLSTLTSLLLLWNRTTERE